MEESIHNLLYVVRTIFMVPVVILMVFAVIAGPALGLKKILEDVAQERRDERRRRTRARLYRKIVLPGDIRNHPET